MRCSTLALIVTPALAVAQPATVAYHGKLMDSHGALVSGPVDMQFAIYGLATGGTPIWCEQRKNVGLSGGYYALLLGQGSACDSPTPVSLAQAFAGADRYLEIGVNGVALSPRLPIASVPYALMAGSSQDSGGNLFPDPYFERGMTFWTLEPESEGAVGMSTSPIAGGKVFANASNKVAWVSSSRMAPLNLHHTYEVKGSFRRQTTNGSAGGVYLAVLLFDENRAAIGGDGVWWYYPIVNLQLGDTTWHTYAAIFGAGSGKPIPATARYMKVGAILNYDGAVPGNRSFEVAGLTIQDLEAPSAALSNDGGVTIAGTGTPVNELLSEPQTLPHGTYLVTYYNCLSATSANYYIQATAVATSGAIVSGTFNKNFDQLTSFTQIPFILKVKSEAATVRFKVYNPAGGTVRQDSPSCTGFYWSQIGL